ncbi:MAG: type II secretion system protein [bacterium]
MKKICFKQDGFTLIELLIVVAIIAILAAIAIPNFLAAQTRAKVTRVKGEFKTLATAIESYNVDANSYPIHISPDPSYQQNGVFGKDDYGSYRFDVLTTPIAYISSIPQDPFGETAATGNVAQGVSYFLYTWQTFLPTTLPEGGGPFLGNLWRASYWALRDRGPDRAWSGLLDPQNSGAGSVQAYYNYSYCPDGDVTLLCYDPTNGTMSRGDIYRTSKKGQF